MKTGLNSGRLAELLSYGPSSGLFTWRVSRPGRWGIKAGDVAGCPDRNGHILITLDQSRYAAHRLAFLAMTGAWPEGVVDHIDGDKANNQWGNLRDVDQSTNMQNLKRHVHRDNRSAPLLGVRKSDSKLNPWAATITAHGVFHHLGVFKTPEAAHAAYLEAKRRLHAGNTL